MKILILGGSGLVGKKILEKFNTKFDVISTYNNIPPSKNFHSVKISLPNDIKVLKELVEKEKPDIVINTMAYSNLDFCEEHKEDAYLLHVKMTEEVFSICSKTNSKIIFVSTDYVFDGKQNKKYTEEDSPNPINYYGYTKALAEKIVLKDPNNIVIRTSLVYGYGKRVRFMKYVIDNLKKGNKVFAYNDIFNSATNLDELVESIEIVINKNASGIFHMVGSTCVTRYDFAKVIARKFEFDESLIKPISIKESKDKAKRPKKPCLDNAKCSKILEYNFSDIESGVLKVLNDIKDS